MKHGDVVGKDAYGREIKVGDIVDIYEWYGLALNVSRKMILGITGGGNYRTINPYLDANGLGKGWVGWEYIKKPVLAIREPMLSTRSPEYYDWMNEYLGKGQPVEMYDTFISEYFSMKERKQYKLELT